MEGMSVEAREEYIWAMKMCMYEDVDDSAAWKTRKAKDDSLKDLTEDESKLKAAGQANDEYRTRVLASFIPDEIIYNVNNYAHRHYSSCLLFGDVSGFTDLCEKYNRTGKSGPSRMTQVLNDYIGSMVQEVMSHNGDVLKFSGDAFLAMWKCTENDPMRDAVHQALDCALAIQKSHGFYETDVGVVIRVKLAISAGHVIFSLIGEVKSSHYVVVGQPIWDVKAAEGKSVAGEIIVSPTAWHHINPTEYIFEEMSDKLHVKVHGVGTNWRNIQKGNRFTNVGLGATEGSSSSIDSDVEEKQGINDEFSLRPAVNSAARMKLKEDLRKFIIAPVMRGIDLDEPLEYLTEMRQVVIVFINVVSHVIDMVETVNLSDRTYKIVNSIVDDMKGCVNKVSLFDKDLMLVCIFGLRGFKHNLESQVALKCAMECHQALSNLPEVKSASIGVTTGMTYCGVFGHTLRREYTVISLIVNKAARLMCAYPYKVTCDRETFLHSKMEAKNFILQEHKELKGISHPGPVYQFKEVPVTQGMSLSVSHFPLLGRDDELSLFHRVLNELIAVSAVQKSTHAKLNHHNMLVIYGDARQGKSRLLDEMVFTTPSKIPVNRYTLTNKDSKIPYEAIRLFFQLPLGLNESSTKSEWEEKLANRLGKLKVKELMCALNSIFNVSYEKTPLYLSLSDEQVKLISQKFIRQLCFRCFLTNWVMAIDDAEFIDEDSWVLLEAILTFDKICTVITIGQRKSLSHVAMKVLQHRRVRKTSLKSINKWFHAGLACQILDVYAIPPELEKVIQSRSNGNPGWVESYLVTLIQAGAILIRKVNRKKIADMGLIAPPLYMLYRLTKEQEEKWKRIVEQTVETHIDDWKMYTDSYKDESETNIPVKGDDILPVCTLSPSFNDGDVDQELSMDVLILKTFDSLTSFEQMILKSSSILGDCFPTDMLLYIMSCNSKRQAALAVQKLFEIRVLSCARGDFLNEGYNLIFKERLINPEHDTGINCGCIGINVEESCEDLPDYASCGYLRFRSSFFRETTYSLLTEKQKKEFHSRAVRYIEKETRQCRACGYGYFTNFLGVRIGAGLHMVRKKKHGGGKKGDVNMHSSSSQMRNASMMISGNSVMEEEMKRTEVEETPYANVGFPGYTAINRLKESYSLTKTFSTFDFSECECIQILTSAYSQMIDHCRGSGAIDQMIEAMIQYAYLTIQLENITQALYTLNDSLKAIEMKPKDVDEVVWKSRVLLGRIYTQIGYANMKLNRLNSAIKYLYTAMEYFGKPFPKSDVSIKFKKFKQLWKQNINMFWYTEMVGKKLETYQADYFCNVSLCLRYICYYFKKENKWVEAHLAATWAINLCLKGGTDFAGLMQCFANMIRLSCHFNNRKTAVALEVNALRICHRKKINIQKEDIYSICKLYYAILLNRYEMGDMDKAEFLCFILIRLCTSVHAVNLMLLVLPVAFQTILNKGQVSVACNLLNELDFYSEEDPDHSGLCWYYALCMQLSIETGYTLTTEKKCTEFFSYKGEEESQNRDPEGLRRYYAVMWLWCVRIEKWEDADIWYPKAIKAAHVKVVESMELAITFLFLLEAAILYLVSKMDKRNIKRVMMIHELITSLFRSLQNCSKRFLFILPRLYHLMAYYRLIKYNDNKAFQILKTAKKFAHQYNNVLEQNWIDHTYKAWKHNLTSLYDAAWKERSQCGHLMDFREFEMNGGKYSFYTLAPPTYM